MQNIFFQAKHHLYPYLLLCLSMGCYTLNTGVALAAEGQHPSVAASIVVNNDQAIDLPTPQRDSKNAALWTLTSIEQSWYYQPTDNTRLWQSMAPTERRLLQNEGIVLYAGPLRDFNGEALPDTWLRLAWVDGQWSGGWFDGEELYLVEHISHLDSIADNGSAAATQANAHRLFRFNDLDLPQLFDGSPLLPATRSVGPDAHNVKPGTRNTGPNEHNTSAFLQHLRQLQRGATTLEQLPVTIVSDTQFSAINGANTRANVAARINFADGIYSNQLGVNLGLLHHEVLTNNSTLVSTDSFTLLPQFASFIRTGAGSSLPRGGIAHLFSGRNFDGGIVGLAYIGALCSINFGYGIDQDFNGNTLSALIFSHELGHNFGAPHDGENACINEPFRGIMNPSINGSTTFSPCSIQQMSDDIANASCLIEIPLLVLDDGFEQ